MNDNLIKPLTKKQDSGDHERISKRLSRSGICSRREAERMIEEGRVRVDGKLITTPATFVNNLSRIIVDDKRVPIPKIRSIWLYHKNPGEIVSRGDPQGRRTIFDNIPKSIGYTVAIGRLDYNSEGLMLLTNDGNLARQLELPQTGWTRRYRVRAYGHPNAKKFKKAEEGCTINGIRYGPIHIVSDKKNQGSNCWLTVSLREGKNREIRRVLEYFDLTVNRLIRTSYGPFQLGNIERGKVRQVSEKVLNEQIPQ